jgi:hypothetical protein
VDFSAASCHPSALTSANAARDGSWSPELAVLLACARPHLRPEDAARPGAAAGRAINSDRLLELAHAHGLIPLLHHHTAAGALQVPSALLPVLKSHVDANARRALKLAGELIGIVDACADAGLPVASLKGPVLAQQLYGVLSMRQIRDLDLLVRHADLPRFLDLLQARGYRRGPDEDPELDGVKTQDLHHVSLRHPDRRVRIEVHYWLLRPRGRRVHGFEDVAPRLRPIPFLGRQVQALDGEDLLTYLCEHGAEHAWCRLEWLAGIARLSRQVDPARAVDSAFARDLGATKRIRAAMDLASLLLDADPPATPPRSIATRFVARRLRREPARVIESSAERFFYGLFTDASATAVARRCWTMLLAPSIGDRRALPLPRWLLPLHWALRPFRLIARQIRRRG